MIFLIFLPSQTIDLLILWNCFFLILALFEFVLSFQNVLTFILLLTFEICAVLIMFGLFSRNGRVPAGFRNVFAISRIDRQINSLNLASVRPQQHRLLCLTKTFRTFDMQCSSLCKLSPVWLTHLAYFPLNFHASINWLIGLYAT